jgi:hypothetical protein
MDDAVEEGPVVRLLCWNLGSGKATWADVESAEGHDVALVQQALDPSGRTRLQTVPRGGSPWGIGRTPARTAIAQLSDRVQVAEVATAPIDADEPGPLGVSRLGSLTVATLTVAATGDEIDVASVYGQWDAPATGTTDYYADAAMHRIVSDLTPLIVDGARPLVIAGDFNSVRGRATDGPDQRTAARRAGIFDRMDALGLHLAGPCAGTGGRETPAVDGSGADRGDVATFGAAPGDRNQQIDYCYVSDDLASRTTVVALNGDAEWGPSDHCRISIEVAAPLERRSVRRRSSGDRSVHP